MPDNDPTREPSLDFKVEPWFAYRFDRDDIARLCNTASSYTGSESNLSVYFSNGNSVSSKNPGVCLDDSNNLTHHINHISITSSNYIPKEVPRTVSVEIRKTNISNVVTVRGSGPRSASVVIRSEIEMLLSASRTWYSFIYYSAYIQGAFVTALSLAFYTYLVYDYKKPVPMEVQIILGVVCAVAVMFPIPLLIGAFLPRASLEVGLGQKRAALRKKIGSFITLTVVVGLVIGVAGNFLSDKLKGISSEKTNLSHDGSNKQ